MNDYYQRNNYNYNNNYNFERNISPVYNRPFFDRNERRQNFVNYQNMNYYTNIFNDIKIIEGALNREKNTNVVLKYHLKEQIKMNIKFENELNIERYRNIDLINYLDDQFTQIKQLNIELESNIQYHNLEDIYNELLYKNNYLQKEFEEEIYFNQEIQTIDDYEERNKFNDKGYNNYYNNGRYNTSENEYNRYNYLEEVLNEEKNKNQNLNWEIYKKENKMVYLQKLIQKEKYLYYELSINLPNELRKLKENLENEKDQKLRRERENKKVKDLKLENNEYKKKYEQEQREKQILIQKNNEMKKKNRMLNQIVKNIYIK